MFLNVNVKSWRSAAAAGVVLLSAGGLLAGCGSSAHKSTTNTTTASTSPSASSTSAPSSGATSTSAPPGSGGTGNSLSAITSKLQGSTNISYDASYTVSGGSNEPKALEFAASPPDKFVFFITNAAGAKSELISAGQLSDSCNQSGSAWTCVQLPQAEFAPLANALEIYKGAYWSQTFASMEAAAAAGGITVTPSTMSAAGQQLQCVSYSGGTAGAGGKVCVTSDGVLAYVHSIASGTTFELTSYSTSPASSLFGLPPGATITTIP